MANKKRDRKKRPSAAGNGHAPAKRGSRGGAKQPLVRQAPTPGLNLFSPLRVSLGRGFYAAGANPILLLLPMLLVFVTWLVILAAGLRYFPLSMATILSIPPISTAFDADVSFAFFGLTTTGWVAMFIFIIPRALFLGLLVGMLDEMLGHRVVTRVGVLRGLRAFPAALLFEYLCLGVTLLSQLLLPGLLGQLGGMMTLIAAMATLFFLVFTPAVGVRQDVTAREAVLRSIRAARLPGWQRHLLMCVLYFLIATVGLQAANPTPVAFTANPSLATWVFVLVSTYIQVGFLGAFIDRFKSVEAHVPTKPAPRKASGPPARRR